MLAHRSNHYPSIKFLFDCISMISFLSLLSTYLRKKHSHEKWNNCFSLSLRSPSFCLPRSVYMCNVQWTGISLVRSLFNDQFRYTLGTYHFVQSCDRLSHVWLLFEMKQSVHHVDIKEMWIIDIDDSSVRFLPLLHHRPSEHHWCKRPKQQKKIECLSWTDRWIDWQKDMTFIHESIEKKRCKR